MESKLLKKESFIENLSNITKGMKQKEIASIMGCTEGTMSKYLNPDKKDFPPVDKLYNLSQYFNVSIDWLIGVEKKEEPEQKLSARAICEMLISIYNSVPFDFEEIQKAEDCADYFNESYGTIEIKESQNTYYSLYFSNWGTINEVPFMDTNYRPKAATINLFLSRFIKIRDMSKEGNLNDEMFSRLLESYLNDVAN
ncbi:helix-turn-helix domain-containing protein [Enterocloster citroniae]